MQKYAGGRKYGEWGAGDLEKLNKLNRMEK
jgi:hypothetical protein